ncbi:unnamed protein product, partial [Meganyctiphanes norvegica]
VQSLATRICTLIKILEITQNVVYIVCIMAGNNSKGQIKKVYLTKECILYRNQKLLSDVCSSNVNAVVSALNNCPKDPYLSGVMIIDSHKYYNMPVLTLAVIEKDIDKVNLLLKDGLDPNFVGDYIYPALVVAAITKQRNSIKSLLQAGANVKSKGLYGITALKILAANNDMVSIQLLYAYECCMVRRVCDWMNPLDLATGPCSIEDWLEAHGIKVHELYCAMDDTAPNIARNVYANLASWLQRNHKFARSIPQLKEKYMMHKKIFVFNYILFDNRMEYREGANIDSENIKNTFGKLGYWLEIYENFTRSETIKQLGEIRNDRSLCSLLVVVLSHGVSRTHFCTSDGKRLDFLDVQRMFTDRNCPSLKGKPKILMGNFCRGTASELVTDSGPKQYEIPRHMVTIYASQEDIMAMRSPQNGTIFINCLCSVLKKYSKERLLEFFDRLAVKMRKNGGTTPRLEISPPSIMNFAFS